MVPALVLLSWSRGKVPWMLIGLFPAVATLQGAGFAAILELPLSVRHRWVDAVIKRRWMGCGLLCVMAAWWMSPLFIRDYEAVLREVDTGQWRGASFSREAAEVMNRVVQKDSRVLLTSFHYWKGLAPGATCPVFAYYSRWEGAALVRPHETDPLSLIGDVKKFRLDWALLSPEPGNFGRKTFSSFMENGADRPWRLRGAYLFRTAKLW
jgi:hypothetical protein